MTGPASRRRPPARVAGARRSRPVARPRPRARRPEVGADHQVGRRMVALLVVLVVALGLVVVRLGQVQGTTARRFALVGEAQRRHAAVLPAERGAIVDRNGVELAMSSQRRTVWADPQQVRDPVAAARALAPLLGQGEASLRARLTGSGAFVYLARKVEDPVADAVAALHVPGVSLRDEPARVDPAGPLALPVLGRVGVDENGLSGLELQYESELRGHPGQLLVEKDPAGRDISSGVHQLRAPVRGSQLRLTIDRDMQYATESALADGIVSANAKGGVAVVMDPRTGDVLAMASLVAGQRGAPPTAAADNAAVTRVYEPGSVNKVVSISAALEGRVVRPTDSLVVPDQIRVADSTFHDAEPHATESMSVSRIVADSSNVGTIMIAERLGKERIDHYLRAFGLTDRTSLRFPGESGGIMPALNQWSGTSLATVPIGQGVAVTPLQMLAAYNAIANGGTYVGPTLVDEVVDAKGKAHPTRRPPPRWVVSADTARTMTQMLQQVVTDGTGTAAALAGYTVAGKTGTAEKPRTDGPGYQPGAYVASFVGFAPAASPRLSAIVVLDEPTPIYGGMVAAPVFAKVAAFGVRLLGVPPDVTPPPGAGFALATAGPPAPVPVPPPDAPAPKAPATTPKRASPTTTTLGRTPTSRP